MAKLLFVKKDVDLDRLKVMYVDRKMSTTLCAEALGVSTSTVRSRLLEAGLLRGISEAVRLAVTEGRHKPGGGPGPMSAAARAALSAAKIAAAEKSAAGVSRKPNGYIEYTRGPFKGRSVHVVAMEKIIGRRLRPTEVVHHKDGVRSNNDPSNLELMTRSEHSSLHAKEAAPQRKRNHDGKFE